ncbi:MAG: Flp1 family type IVb pilin [Bilifractor sp.]
MKNYGRDLVDFLKEEDGISTVEIVLIIVVLIGLVIIFKSQLTSLVSNILSKITSKSDSI